MPNGKPGDHPFTDIVVHGRDVYSPQIASLVREIAQLADETRRRGLADLLFLKYNESSNPDLLELQRLLTEMRNGLVDEAKKRGLEI